MLRPKKRLKLLLIGFLAVSIGTSIISCAGNSIQKPPEVNLYLHFKPKAVALCSNSKGDKCPKVPISETDNWIMLKPKDFEKIQNYIDYLTCVASGACKGSQDFKVGEQDLLTLLEETRSRMGKIKNTLHIQRK